MDYDNRMIWIVRSDGDDLRELAPGNPVDGKVSPDISPDGKTVVFSSWNPLRRIYEVTLPTGEPRLLSTDCSGVGEECSDEDPAYSADGSRIAFVRTQGTVAEGRSEIAIMDLATGAVTLLEATGIPIAEGWLAQPSWSPDGTQIVYHRVMQTQTATYPTATSLLIAEADGTAVRELPTPPARTRPTPTGRRTARRSCSRAKASGRRKAAASRATSTRSEPDGTGLVELLPGWAPSWTPGWAPHPLLGCSHAVPRQRRRHATAGRSTRSPSTTSATTSDTAIPGTSSPRRSDHPASLDDRLPASRGPVVLRLASD